TRQTQHHACPAWRPVLELDRATVSQHDLTRDREAEPGTVALRGEERLEEPRAVLGIDARPLVLDHDLHAVRGAPDADADRAAVGHGLARVAQQVEQRLFDLAFVDRHRPELLVDLELEPNRGLFELSAAEVARAPHDVGELLEGDRARSLASEGEVLLTERAQPLDLARDRAHERARLFRFRSELFFEELEIQRDGGERVSDLVRDV